MIQLLRDIAVDSELPTGPDNPLRQIVVNTHSPIVIEHVDPGELIYMDAQKIRQGASWGQVAWVRVPGASWRAKSLPASQQISPGQILPYLRGRSDARQKQLLLEFAPPSS